MNDPKVTTKDGAITEITVTNPGPTGEPIVNDNSQKLIEVKAAIREHHFNLDLRHQAAGSALQIVEKLMVLFDMPYVQGDELRRRSQGEKKK